MSGEKTDEALYLSFRDSADEGSLSSLVARHWERSFRLALGLTGDPASAEDVAQEAFVQVVQAAREKKTLDPFGGWLATVVLNGARKSLRGQKRRVRHEDEARARRQELSSAAAGAIEEYVEKLPSELATPLLLHYGLGLTQEETARALGCPTGTVATRLRTAVARLRETVSAGVAIEALIKEAFADARASACPTAPRAVDLSKPAGGFARPSKPVFVKVAPAVALVAVAAIAIAILARGASSPTNVASDDASASTSKGASSSGDNESKDASSSKKTPPIVLAPPSPGAATNAASSVNPALARFGIDETALAESEEKADPYPWTELSTKERERTGENERLLEERKLSINFEGTPFKDAVAQWNDLREVAGTPALSLSPEASAFVDEESLKVYLRLSDISGHNTLQILCGTSEKLAWNTDGSGARISLRTASDATDRAARSVQTAHVLRKRVKAPAFEHFTDERRDWIADYKQQLAGPIDLDFENATLAEVVDKVQESSKLNVTVGKEVDQEEIKLTGRLRGAHLDEALTAFLKPAGLRFLLKNEMLFITAQPEPEPDPVWTRKLSIDKRGVTTRALVKALLEQNVTLVVSPEAWRSNATLSLVAKDVSADELASAINGQLPLEPRGRFLPVVREGASLPNAGLVYAGSVASAREALTVALPGYKGVATRIEALRAELATALVDRSKARLASSTPVGELTLEERAVHALAARILGLVARSKALAGARARKSALSDKALDEAKVRLSIAKHDAEVAGKDATLKQKIAVFGAEARVDEIEHDLAENSKDVALLEKLEQGESLPEDSK